MNKKSRTFRIEFRVNAEELAIITRAATEAHAQIGPWLRALALDVAQARAQDRKKKK